MPRGATTAVLNEIANTVNQPFNLVEIQFTTPLFFTDADRDVTWNSKTFLANGNLTGIGNIDEDIELRIGSISITLSGVALANISTALTEDYIGKKLLIYKAFMLNGSLVVDPFTLGQYVISGMSISESYGGNGTASVSWTASSYWADFQRVGGRRTNSDDQQVHFPNDFGLEFAPLIIKDVHWGR